MCTFCDLGICRASARRSRSRGGRWARACPPRWRAFEMMVGKLKDLLHRITTPTLILVGEEDAVTLPEMADRLHERIASSRLLQLPHGGHMSNLEQPEAVNAAISTFLDEMRGAPLQAE
ncbi:alpha/beta fold hydrolase [Corallococcus carmarthensis]|uniref:Alpha/beta fold hydrolase n=1 Tax=Corallococcus carmarthensis TaxID=2316728 RepID=A0A3A8KIX4_9BACT|nr:alpha/beta hydrolase [Corallococcus carmarthensis]RKH07059.1 alpha/beta fold hydrolase [Corallococcus carmarthensis]